MSRGSSASGSVHDDGYSDSEAGRSSISGSRKAKSEQIASSEISTANVLQDGRRGQTIFDSSVSARKPGMPNCFMLIQSDSSSLRPTPSPCHCFAIIDFPNVGHYRKKDRRHSTHLHRSFTGFILLPCYLLRATSMALAKQASMPPDMVQRSRSIVIT